MATPGCRPKQEVRHPRSNRDINVLDGSDDPGMVGRGPDGGGDTPRPSGQRVPRTPMKPGVTTRPGELAASGALLPRLSTNRVAPAATPTIPTPRPTLATVWNVLPSLISPDLLAGQLPLVQLLLRSLKSELLMKIGR